MTHTKLFLILSLALLLASAGCTGFLPAQNPETVSPSETPLSVSPETSPDTSTPQVQTVTDSGGSTSLSRLVVWADTVDCDGFHDMDGLVLKYRFSDAMNRPVLFDGTSISMDITIFTPDTDRRNLQISPRLLYRGSTTISRSLPEGDYPLRGIWIPYTELSLASQDRGIGRIHIRATLPNGVVLEAEERYIWPQKR